MFSFNVDNYDIIEKNVNYEDMQEKYPNNYMIAVNCHVKNKRIHGDVVALLTKEEYEAIRTPGKSNSRYDVWVGDTLRIEGLKNYVGIYL